MNKILVFGYGNPGRQDDSLGVTLANMIEEWAVSCNLFNLTVDSNYQLNIEDAYNLNSYDYVIFIDASKEPLEDFLFQTVEPLLRTNFTMHAVSPAFVAGLGQEMYRIIPQVFSLAIKGYEWEFMADISSKAQDNLKKAFDFLKEKILELADYESTNS